MTSRKSKTGRGRSPRSMRRYMPEAAAVLWLALFIATLPVPLPALELTWLANILRWLALGLVGVTGAGFLAVVIDETWLALRRWRVRRRAERRGGAWDGWR
jgi:hypothetical protein